MKFTSTKRMPPGTNDHEDSPRTRTTTGVGSSGLGGSESGNTHDARSMPISRRFSETMRKTGESLKRSIEGCSVEDVSNIMDVQLLLESIQGDAVNQEDASTETHLLVGKETNEEIESMSSRLKKEDVIRKHQDRSAVRRDEIAFFLGVVNVALIGFWMGHSPETYYHYWTFKSIVLFSWRWYRYRQKGFQYLMLELCYFGNFLGMLHVYVWPQNLIMRKLTFSVFSGPLMWSIMAMRNSLVFHDVDKITTLMMHASPALAGWSLRWFPDDHYRMNDSFAVASLTELVGLPILFYCCWVVLYYFVCFVFLNDRIRKQGGVTMFDIMVPKDKNKVQKSIILRFITSFREVWQPVVYLALHGTMASISFVPTYLFWNHFVLHTCALLFCLSLSVWNGGTFYFKVFAKRYYHDMTLDMKKNS